MLTTTPYSKKLLPLLIPVAMITACGGGSDDSSDNIDDVNTSTFSLAISDAPVDDLSAVIVCFNQIQLKRNEANGGDVIFTVGGENGAIEANDLCLDDDNNVIADTVGLNLLDYAGSDSINLITGAVIEAGDYTKLRIAMSEGSYGIDSDTGGKIKVSVPSNELKLDGFTAAIGGVINFTLEFDLRKSMVNPVGQEGYFLKPNGIRLVDNSKIGHISGSVAESLLTDNQVSHGCIFSPEDLSTAVASVYLYAGNGLESDLTALSDNGGNEEHQPVASTTVTFDGVQSYNFEIGFINANDYTIAVSCDVVDDPEADDDVVFIEAKNVKVEESNTPVEVTFGL